jgi:hypothetical protein
MFVHTGIAFAADPDVGCGVGTQVMEGQKGRPAKLMASFTNGLTFQSISITFGLLNCNNVDGAVQANAADLKLQHYASQNFDRLAEEIAAGEGERLDVVAHLRGVRVEDQAAFRSFAQQNFERLFPHDQVTVGEMLSSLKTLMAEDDVFSVYIDS